MTLRSLANLPLPFYGPPDAPGAGAAPPAASPSTPASPAPASPEPAPTEPSPAGEADGGFTALGGFDDDDGDETIVLDPSLVPPVEGAEGATPGSPPATPAQAKPPVDPKAPPAPAPAAAAPKEPAPAVPAAQTPAQPAPAEPQGLVQQLDQHREAVIDGLAAERFKLSKEEADALEINAPEAVSRLMAKTYYQATQSALLHIQNFVPQMVVNMVKALKSQQDAEDAFYGAHKHLDRTKHSADVNQFAQVFRTANPQGKPEDILSMVAAAVMAKYGIQPGAPAAPAAPAAPSPQPSRTPSFVPARPGASVRVTPEEENPFAGLAKDFDD